VTRRLPTFGRHIQDIRRAWSWNRRPTRAVSISNRPVLEVQQPNVNKERPDMNLNSVIQRRFGRVAIVFALVALVVLGSVAFAYASSPNVLPVEPDGGIGGEVILPVEPDGGIGGEVILPVEPDGGIGN
jgi:hypothetical protein